MSLRSRLLTFAAIAGFTALLLYNTLSAQNVECQVCVEFQGRRNCATASHASEHDAAQSAQNTACGVLANGMTESLACGRTPPVSTRCRTL